MHVSGTAPPRWRGEEKGREYYFIMKELERRRRAAWKLTRDYCVGAAPRQR